MPAFATVADLADHLQTTIAAGQATDAAQMALDAATAAIRSHTGQRISAVDEDQITLRVTPTTRDIFLPELPVTAVTSVTLDGTALVLTTDYLVDLRLGMLRRPYAAAWGTTVDSTVVVVYDHGYAVIPADVKWACLVFAESIYNGQANVSSFTIGAYSQKNGDDASLISAQAIVESYRPMVAA